ncbi:MAG: hypothetical protein JWO71_162 [Candidatus Acidoferrum typicum]|nr:hypothetical protein [Candidatus Acidoferrum typicum]
MNENEEDHDIQEYDDIEKDGDILDAATPFRAS